MPLRIAAQRYFTETVVTHSDVPGGPDQTYKATFRVLDPEDSHFPNTPDGLRDFLREAIADIEDVIDEEKTPVPFGPELLALLLKAGDQVAALHRAYIQGVGRAKAGN